MRGIGLLGSPRGRRVLFALLYFSEGAPIGFLWWALAAALRRGGVDNAEISGLLGALALPWAGKFLWAPLVDVLRGPRWTLRGWIAASQSLMIATLLPLLWLDPVTSLGVVTPWLLAHAFAAATQDVAIDALAIAHTGDHERGALNGWMQVGMLLGRALFGGGALLVRGEFGDTAMLVSLLATLTVALAVNLCYRIDPSVAAARAAPSRRLTAFVANLRAMLGATRTWLGLAFAAAAGAAFEAVGATASPLLVDYGSSDAQAGTFLALAGALGLAIGAVTGGAAADRYGRRATIVATSLGTSAATAALALATGGDSGVAVLVALAAVYLGAGALTASTYALFMDLTDPRLGSTQFSAFMGATNLCEWWSATLAGALVTRSGYTGAFAAAAGLAVLALPLLAFLAPARPATQRGP